MFASKSFWLGVFSSLFGLLLAAELAMRLTVPQGFWYRHWDISGDLTSLPELRDRIRYSTSQRPIFLLGDSVLGASALAEHRVADARSQTLSHQLTALLAAQGRPALSLGADGNLLTDLLALSTEMSPQPGDRVLLLLNFRMFAKEFADGQKGLAHSFLAPDLPADIQSRVAPDPPLSEEARLSDGLYDRMAQHWMLFRETQMLKTLWYYPSQKDFFQRLLEKAVGTNDTQNEIAEAALKQKIASYYLPYLWTPTALPESSLRRLLDLYANHQVKVMVILTPQNPKFLGSVVDKPSFQKNRAELAKFIKAYRNQGIQYQDWADRYAPDLFFDHCHLKPEGNDRYAKALAALLGAGS
jgi:hypothetical protein